MDREPERLGPMNGIGIGLIVLALGATLTVPPANAQQEGKALPICSTLRDFARMTAIDRDKGIPEAESREILNKSAPKGDTKSHHKVFETLIDRVYAHPEMSPGEVATQVARECVELIHSRP